MKQTDRIERVLRQRGAYGLTQVDFLLPDVVDGAKPITRLAARIHDLRERGLHIPTEGERDGVAVYVLKTAPVSSSVEETLHPQGPRAGGVLGEDPGVPVGHAGGSVSSTDGDPAVIPGQVSLFDEAAA